MYSTRTRVHARIPNGHPREEKRASDKSPRTSLVGELNGVGFDVRVGPVEFKLKDASVGCLQHVSLAKQFEQLVRQDARFDVMNDVTLGLVCFRVKVRHLCCCCCCCCCCKVMVIMFRPLEPK